MGNEARMNRPLQASGNWDWRMDRDYRRGNTIPAAGGDGTTIRSRLRDC